MSFEKRYPRAVIRTPFDTDDRTAYYAHLISHPGESPNGNNFIGWRETHELPILVRHAAKSVKAARREVTA